MAQIVRGKDLKCFEWNVTAVADLPFLVTSKSFFFKQQEFKLRLSYDFKNWLFILNFQRKKNLNNSTKIIVNVSSSVINEYTKTFTIAKEIQEIWRQSSKLTFIPLRIEVIFKDDILKETGTTSTKDTSQGKLSSYLEETVHLQGLSRDCLKLLKEHDDTNNVTIACEGKTFRAHKNILHTRSGVMSAMLKSDMVEGKTGLITLTDIKVQIFECFLQYLYTGNLPELSMDNAKEFYKVGDQYAVKELKRACSEYMIKNMSESNACEVLVLADQHSDKDFREKIITYIVETDIPKHDCNWSDFCERHCILAVQILNVYITKQ